MYCLWNGEYGEHDLSFVSGLNQVNGIIENQKKQYEQWIGVVVGDFTCLKVEYDWGRRDQRWTIKCNLCGKVSYQYHVQDWRRGKGRKTVCDCRREREKIEKLQKRQNEIAEIERKIKKYIGKTYYGWKVVEYSGYSCCKVECVECGKQSERKIDDVVSGSISACNHKIPTDFSGDEWIGRRNGHLTVIGRVGSKFLVKCDCGATEIVKPTFMFVYKSKTACTSSDCPYSTQNQKVARERREKGFAFEREMEKMLIAKGYDAKKTKDQSDYGVDIVINHIDGSKIAVQCKKQTAPAGVNAIQEVYAGGRFYDCEKFAIICETGFSPQAIDMAKKLGIYLCDGEFDFPNDMDEYTKNLLPVYRRNEKLEKLYEIDGERKTLGEWCLLYRKSITTVRKRINAGATLKTALITPLVKNEPRKYTVDGFTGTLNEICNHFGILRATVDYRMSHKGMSVRDAVLCEKMTNGRKKKQPAPGQGKQTAPDRRMTKKTMQINNSTEQFTIQGF